MSHDNDVHQSEPINEMAIVDTFTKLIFGQESHYSSSEQLIIQVLRLVDPSVAVDSHRDMGQYLRAMGVDEMIQLVARVQSRMSSDARYLPRVSSERKLDHRAH